MTQNTPIQKDITINELAARIDTQFDTLRSDMNSGFKDVNESIDHLAQITAKEFKIVHTELGEVKTIIREHGARIRRVEQKLQLA